MFDFDHLSDKHNLPPHILLTVATLLYREQAGTAGGGFDPSVHLAALLAAGEYVEFRAEIFQLQLLTKNLRDIRGVRPDVADMLRSRLMKRTGTFSNYIGLRMEARIASSLSRRGVDFDYDDAPDFSVRHEGQALAIECTSIHVDPSTPPDKDLSYKITSAVRKKANMPYADGSLAIAVDISGIVKVRQGQTVDRDQHAALVKAASSDSLVGSVLLFHAVAQDEKKRLDFVYSRHDSQRASPELVQFLEKQYPIETRWMFGGFYA